VTRPQFFEAEEEIECPTCEREIPIRVEISPHRDTTLH